MLVVGDLATGLEVLELVGRGNETADAVASASGLPVAAASAALTSLELAGSVRSDASGRYGVAP